MRPPNLLLVGLTLVPLVGGCIGAAEEEEAAAGVVLDNGQRLNGQRLNGQRLNGQRLNGQRLNGTAFNGVTTGNGELFGGQDPIGQGDTLFVMDDSGVTAVIQVTGVRTGWVYTKDEFSQDAYHLAHYYQLGVFDQATALMVPFCENGAEVVPIAGHWDEATGAKTNTLGDVTLACLGYAIGKCFEMGYVPAFEVGMDPDAYQFPDPNEQMHQACVRAVRADFCGNGISQTIDGTLVDFYDVAGIQQRVTQTVEAAWTPDGATCLHVPRITTISRSCILPDCTSNFQGGAILQTGL